MNPCPCWTQVVLHAGHCCIAETPDDYQPPAEIPCGHRAEGMALMEAARASRGGAA